MGEVRHAGRREVGLGDGEVLGRSVELDAAGRLLEVNEEVGDTKIFLRVGSKHRKSL